MNLFANVSSHIFVDENYTTTMIYMLRVIIYRAYKFLVCVLMLLSSLYRLYRDSNSNSTFIVLNVCQKTDSKAHHTKILFNIHKPETLQGSALWRNQEEIGNLGWV